MRYKITNADHKDLPVIYSLFEEAIIFIQKKNYTGWKNYDKQFIQSDIENRLLFKIIYDTDIAGIFCICLSDDLIWREKENGDAIYLHRIVTNRKFAGEKLFKEVLDWATQFAKRNKLKHIRMDTWAENEKIISYYKSYGFSFIENYTTPDTDNLPKQHRNLCVALLEKAIATEGNS
ncbi:MAG: GNAT family N-acetyltransferase [Ferruginibacter sp.]